MIIDEVFRPSMRSSNPAGGGYSVIIIGEDFQSLFPAGSIFAVQNGRHSWDFNNIPPQLSFPAEMDPNIIIKGFLV